MFLKYKLPVFIIISLFGHFSQNFYAQSSASKLTTEKKIDSLLAIMTVEEKVGQLNLYNGFWKDYV